jgi:hypothetical protein
MYIGESVREIERLHRIRQMAYCEADHGDREAQASLPVEDLAHEDAPDGREGSVVLGEKQP